MSKLQQTESDRLKELEQENENLKAELKELQMVHYFATGNPPYLNVEGSKYNPKLNTRVRNTKQR